jgi:hypothetical protein
LNFRGFEITQSLELRSLGLEALFQVIRTNRIQVKELYFKVQSYDEEAFQKVRNYLHNHSDFSNSLIFFGFLDHFKQQKDYTDNP